MLKRRVMWYLYCFLQGAFNYVNIVIEPLDQVSNSVSVLCKDGELLVVTGGVSRLFFSKRCHQFVMLRELAFPWYTSLADFMQLVLLLLSVWILGNRNDSVYLSHLITITELVWIFAQNLSDLKLLWKPLCLTDFDSFSWMVAAARFLKKLDGNTNWRSIFIHIWNDWCFLVILYQNLMPIFAGSRKSLISIVIVFFCLIVYHQRCTLFCRLFVNRLFHGLVVYVINSESCAACGFVKVD